MWLGHGLRWAEVYNSWKKGRVRNILMISLYDAGLVVNSLMEHGDRGCDN